MSKDFTGNIKRELKGIDHFLTGDQEPEQPAKKEKKQPPPAPIGTKGKRGRPQKPEGEKAVRYTFVTDRETIDRVKGVMWKVKKTKIKDVINAALIEYLEKHER